ncbi:type II toxin-antitoxin system death-on-curing family toxin [Bacillus horti]|uniref:Death-on-curing protein n=1 Tax=Caldalkalibacillus horti TaxID=77523 RepID=A0ABT9VZ07_9BACI|nr:type II toxin-antitoxin system death-on-curing family toxin [Bacillus horti]MDQ0166226.1 death-on-curing protein [Bacillus horti]
MRYLTEKEVIVINQLIIMKSSPSEQIGIKDAKLLNSAIHRPQQSVFGEDAYHSIYEKAAALFQSLAMNHPFHNANKRTAFMSLNIFLKKNRFDFVMDTKQAEDFTVDLVNKKYSFEEIASIIEQHAVHRNDH